MTRVDFHCRSGLFEFTMSQSITSVLHAGLVRHAGVATANFWEIRSSLSCTRHKGSKRDPPEGLTFYSEQFALERHIFKERVLCKTMGSNKNPFHSKTPFWKKEHC